jgi:hypothetical protein
MATIDNLDLNIYNLYALRTKMIEQTNQQLRLDQAASIPPQTMVLDIWPKLTELDLLLGIVPTGTPWALFYPPKAFRDIRRSPFAFSRIAPSLGDEQEQEDLEEEIEEMEVDTDDDKEKKVKILACLKEIKKINSWLGFIIGRVGQFLQG